MPMHLHTLEKSVNVPTKLMSYTRRMALVCNRCVCDWQGYLPCLYMFWTSLAHQTG